LGKRFQKKVNNRFCSASKDLSGVILIEIFDHYSSYTIKIKTKKKDVRLVAHCASSYTVTSSHPTLTLKLTERQINSG
jgi:hypothetical protein